MCPSCGGRSFTVARWTSPAGDEWPALECALCGAVSLTQAVSERLADRSRVRELRDTEPPPTLSGEDLRVAAQTSRPPSRKTPVVSGTFQLAALPRRRFASR
jgi:hypothetical protein